MDRDADKELTKINIDEYRQFFELQEDEKILKIITRNNNSYFISKIMHSIYFWLIILLIYLINLGLPYQFLNESPYDLILNIIIIIWAIYIVIAAIVGLWFVRGHVYFITNERIIMIRKFLTIMFREIDYKRITDLVLFQSLWGRIFNFGNLMPVTAGVEMGIRKMGRFSIEGISDVFEIRNLILQRIKDYQDALRKKFKEPNQKNQKPSSPNTEV